MTILNYNNRNNTKRKRSVTLCSQDFSVQSPQLHEVTLKYSDMTTEHKNNLYGKLLKELNSNEGNNTRYERKQFLEKFINSPDENKKNILICTLDVFCAKKDKIPSKMTSDEFVAILSAPSPMMSKVFSTDIPKEEQANKKPRYK